MAELDYDYKGKHIHVEGNSESLMLLQEIISSAQEFEQIKANAIARNKGEIPHVVDFSQIDFRA